MKLRDIITDDEGFVLEPAFFWGAISFFVGLGLEIYSVIYQHPFDLQAYGIGVCALLAGLGLGKKLSAPESTQS